MPTPHPVFVPPDDATLLERTWAAPRGVIGFLRTVDHKSIGLRFIVTAFVFFLAGGIQALLMRLQLVQPLGGVLSADLYNQIFTMHGTTMMFFFAVPVLEGLGIYFVPLLVGARETAFPRLNAFSYFAYLIAGLTLYGSLLFGVAPDAGWFSYTPLTLREFSPASGIDYWALSVTLIEFSALGQAVTLIATILKLRAPGMSLNRMPVVVWAYLVMSLLMIFAMPALILASILLEADRTIGTQFYNAAQGGDPLLWQHLFWWFGHPDVYIIFLPGVGIVAAIVAVFARRELVGYLFVVLSFVAIGFINFWVWVHHMFATGLPRAGLAFFTAATMLIAIPSGVQIFSWLATVWSSPRLVLRTPFYFTIGFIVVFVLGGITGVTLAAVPFNLQVHDTYYVVAHFHYVLIGGMLFPLFAAFHYWTPKITGRMLSDRAGVWTFWLLFIGFNLTFFPLHFAGFFGMPRRVYTYQAGLGLETPNLLATGGTLLIGGAVLVFLGNLAWSRRRGPAAGHNPWNANTLEWAVPSPPPDYNFRNIPSVRSRNPVWTQPELAVGEPGHGDPIHHEVQVLVELRDDRRETLGTTALDAEPESRIELSGPSIWPCLTAVAVAIGIVGVVISPWFLVLGAALAFVTLTFWHYPTEVSPSVPTVGAVPTGPAPAGTAGVRRFEASALPDETAGPSHPAWWGMLLFVAIEAVMFAGLMVTYFYLRQFEVTWPPPDVPIPDLLLPTIYTVVLLASSGALYYGQRGITAGRQRALVLGLGAALGLAALFLALKVVEFVWQVDYTWGRHAYGSISWTLSWFHGAHVLSVLLKGGVVLVLAMRGYFTGVRRLGVELTALYWHFVVVVWLPLYVILYLSPRFL